MDFFMEWVEDNPQAAYLLVRALFEAGNASAEFLEEIPHLDDDTVIFNPEHIPNTPEARKAWSKYREHVKKGRSNLELSRSTAQKWSNLNLRQLKRFRKLLRTTTPAENTMFGKKLSNMYTQGQEHMRKVSDKLEVAVISFDDAKRILEDLRVLVAHQGSAALKAAIDQQLDNEFRRVEKLAGRAQRYLSDITKCVTLLGLVGAPCAFACGSAAVLPTLITVGVVGACGYAAKELVGLIPSCMKTGYSMYRSKKSVAAFFDGKESEVDNWIQSVKDTKYEINDLLESIEYGATLTEDEVQELKDNLQELIDKNEKYRTN